MAQAITMKQRWKILTSLGCAKVGVERTLPAQLERSKSIRVSEDGTFHVARRFRIAIGWIPILSSVQRLNFGSTSPRLRRCQNRSGRISTVPSARRLDSGATSPRPRRCRNAIGPDRNRSGGRRWNVPSDEALQKHDQARSKSIRCATVVFGSTSTRPVLGAQEAAASVGAVGASSDCGTPST